MNVVQFSPEPLLRVAQAFAATPRIMTELSELLRDPSSDLKDVATLLKADTTLAARLLRIANSAAFAPSVPVASLDEAAALVGMREIHRLVGAVTIDHFSTATFPLYGFAGRRLRENSLFVALLAEELAGSTRRDSASAYTAGLFRSLGKVALEKLASESRGASVFVADGAMDLFGWEKHSFGISANDATAAILQQWRFPTEIGAALAKHYFPTSGEQPLAWLVNFAANVAEKHGFGLPGEARYWIDLEKVERELNMDPDQTARAIDRARSAFDRMSSALG